MIENDSIAYRKNMTPDTNDHVFGRELSDQLTYSAATLHEPQIPTKICRNFSGVIFQAESSAKLSTMHGERTMGPRVAYPECYSE